MTLREGLRSAGARTFVVLAIIVTLDNLQSSGLAVLAPNIQSSFHVSTGAITFVAGISGGFLVLGIVPMGWLADRFRRAPIIGWATFVFGLMVFATGLATNIFVFFLARFGAGISQSSNNSVHGSLLADTYPISVRGRIYAGHGDGHRRRHRPQPAPGRPHRDRGGGPERVAVGLLHPGHPDLLRGVLRLPPPRAPAWAVREEGRAGRGHRRSRGRPRRRWRRRSSGSCASARSRRASSPSRRSGSACSPSRCSATSTSSSASVSTRSSADSSAPSAASACWWPCHSSGATTTASTARIRRGP